jgi:hypothetical protein
MTKLKHSRAEGEKVQQKASQGGFSPQKLVLGGNKPLTIWLTSIIKTATRFPEEYDLRHLARV